MLKPRLQVPGNQASDGCPVGQPAVGCIARQLSPTRASGRAEIKFLPITSPLTQTNQVHLPMKPNLLFLLAACLSVPITASAQQVVFRHEASLSGTLAGVPFGPTQVVLRGVGDLANRQPFSNGFLLMHNSATVDIAGVGAFDFVSPTLSFVNQAQQLVGFSRGNLGGLDFLDGPFDASLANWDMLSAIGPLTGPGGSINWDLGDIVTSGGVLDVFSANVTVTFGSSPCVSAGLAYCLGDGSSAQCPCAGFGNAGEGCLNSSGSGGARLVGSGDPCYAIDSFQFALSGVPDGKPGILLMAGSQVANPMADGIRCVGGSMLRSQVQLTVGGGTLFTDFSGQPFGAVALVGAPSNFQFLYRDVANTCSGQGFNYSGGWTVTYQP